MLPIFTKKQYLKDLLEDFVDIHNHILPGIDDGAKSIEESIDLIIKLKNLGVKEFIPTPHVMQDFYPNTDETIGDSYFKLLESLTPKLLSTIRINPAAEYMMDYHFENLVEGRNLFTIKGNFVLVEMSYFQPPINLEQIIFKIKTSGYLPILAHPERYGYYHNNKSYYKKLKQLGCFFQLNLLSLSSYYGNNVEKTANYLIDENLIDFAATDVHNEKQIELLSNLTLGKNQKTQIIEIISNTKNNFSV